MIYSERLANYTKEKMRIKYVDPYQYERELKKLAKKWRV